MALEEYRDKRDFDRTSEPSGGGRAGASPAGLTYVIQKHAASRLHYDFRLELDGVLLSWAVPKGPSLNPRDRHLAARVEDHPLEYGSFEGIIPKGEYGGGTVELWDRGTWHPEAEPHAGLEKGDLKFTLHGEKLKGSWVLVRMKGRPGEESKENWLLIKHRDEHAVDGDGQAILSELDRSVVSGRTIDEIAAGADAGVDASGLSNVRRIAEMPRFVKPELATLVEKAPQGDKWLHEVKFDGYRALGRVENGRAAMYSRNDKDWTHNFQLVADDLVRLPVKSALLDGEVVVQMPDGTTSFQELQSTLGTSDGADSGGRLVYYVFDLLYLDGYELLGSPIEERKQLLKRLLSKQPGGLRIMYSEHTVGGGPEFLNEACKFGLEGVISKAAGGQYGPGVRGPEWLKTKCRQEQEFIVGGFTDPAGARVGFGSLLLGVRDDRGLRYVGNVGTGFSDRLLLTLGERVRGMEIGEPPFDVDLDRAPKGSHWVRPELVAQVAFMEWTRGGGIRHPSFKGLREDKSPAEVVEEEPALAAPAAARPGPGRTRQKAAPHTSGGESVTLTHAEKVFWPAAAVTKQGLADHYARVAPLMLPHVLGRPIAMVRCPEGVDGVARVAPQAGGRPNACFFYKHPAVDFKGPLDVVTIVETEGPHRYLAITEPGSLTALVQMGVLEIHVWGATWPDIERPDMLVFDFDPDPAVEWQALADAARLMRDVLKALGLETFVKTTGGKGLHVVVPITPKEDWGVVHGFCKAVADAFVVAAPDRYTANMAKAKRTGKIYVDYVRNTRGATSIAPYSTRAKEHATVSVPLRWEELDGSIRPDSFTVTNLDARLMSLEGDPWEGFREAGRGQTISDAMKRAVRAGDAGGVTR